MQSVTLTSAVVCAWCFQAQEIELHPLYIMLPCTLCASLAFMLPVATPPNAIVFSYGNLKVVDMVSPCPRSVHYSTATAAFKTAVG